MSASITDVSRRSRRLQERNATQDRSDDGGEVENHRLSAGGVLWLNVPSATPNLRTTQDMCETEVTAPTLDAYNAGDMSVMRTLLTRRNQN